MKAIVLAGGEGKRLRPLTCTIPKPLMPVTGHPIAEYIISLLKSNGFDEIVFTLNYLSNEMISFIDGYKDMDIKLSYITESSPLGTAGSVLNVCKNWDEPFLVICGDCMTDINLSKIALYHKSINADVTIVCSKVNDPREYGTLSVDKNGKITSFNEKPSWNYIESDLVNTGIYFISPNVVKLIKEDKFQDFAKDIFPLMLKNNMNLYGYHSSGYWCDIGEFDAYRKCNEDLLKGRIEQNLVDNRNGIFGNYNTVLDNCKIIPPVYLGRNVKIGDNSVIGPYTVISDNSVIEDNSKLKKSIVFSSSYIGTNSDIIGSIIGSNVLIKDNSIMLEGSVIGDKCMIDSNVKISNNIFVWPEKKIINNSSINENFRYGKSDCELLSDEAVNGYSYTELSVEKCCKIGSAFASVDSINKIAIGYSVDTIAKTSSMALLSGLISSGAEIYDFGECFESQLRFYVRYCRLDGGIYILQNKGRTAITVIGKNGFPLTSSQERVFEKNYKNSDFIRSFEGKCLALEDTFDASQIYESKLLSYCINGFSQKGCHITSNNELINNITNRCYKAFSGVQNELPMFTIDLTGKRLSVKDEKDNFVSYDTALILCCFDSFQKGNDVCVYYDAPIAIDSLAKEYNCKVKRIVPSSSFYDDETNSLMDSTPWAFDALFMTFNILSIIKSSKKTLSQLVYDIPVVNIQRRVIDLRAYPDKIRKIFPSAQKTDSGTIIVRPEGTIHISSSSNGRFIKVSAEAKSAEISEELCADVENKIKTSSIDISVDKL